MEKEQPKSICEHFYKGSPCKLAKWIIVKPFGGFRIPKIGCGRTNIEKCPRKLVNFDEKCNPYGPGYEEEFDILMPKEETNSKGEKKRLPGGIHR